MSRPSPVRRRAVRMSGRVAACRHWLCQTGALLFFILGSMTLMLPALAQSQTEVSGVIASDQTWTAAQSPYVLQGEVVVENGAVLRIQPGVTVRMARNAGFTLRQGAVQAVGTALAPILITSDAASPAAGDWRQWRFGAGTDSARTLLEHVIIEYGAGLAIEAAAPVIRNTELRQHSAAAIQMDLASSPTGTGNRAHGNALNAIVVPAGTIRAQVIWGLAGIPYLVRDGLVQVGQAPLALEPARLRLAPGAIAILRASLAQPAGAAGANLDAASSVPSVTSAVSRVTIGAGQSGGDIEVQAIAPGTSRITLSHVQLGMAETIVEVAQLPALSLVPGHPTLGIGQPYPMTLSLPAPAPVGGTTVQLRNTDTTVLSAPASVLVPAGQSRAHFEVTGLMDGQSRLSAHFNDFTDALATLTVRSKALVLPASVVVAPGGAADVVLEITEPAPAGGLTVHWASSNAAAVQAPAPTTIAAGSGRAQATVQGTTLGTAELTASAAGYQAASSTVLVDAIAIHTEPQGDITTNAGLGRTLRVLLSKAAPPGGITMVVASSAPDTAAVSPAQIVVPQGQVYATSPITIQGLAAGQAQISVSAPGLPASTFTVTVLEGAALRLMPQNGTRVMAGKGMRTYQWGNSGELRVQRLINGSAANGADAVTVSLRCVSESVCTVPATVTIPAGHSQAVVPVTGVEAGITQIEATAPGYAAAAAIDAETVLPEVVFHNLDDQRTTSSVRDNFSISLRVPGAAWPDSAVAAQALTVNLSLVEQTPDGVVTGFYSTATGGSLMTQTTIGPGSNSSNRIYIAQPSMAGTYRVRADVAGITGAQSPVQTVIAAQQALRLMPQSGTKVTVGKGLRSYGNELRVQRLINGSAANGADAVTVSLRCVSEAVCTVPATVTIPAGQSQAAVPVTGVDAGSTQIEASAAGFGPGAVTVETIIARLVISNAPAALPAGGTRHIYAGATVPGAAWPDSQYPATDQTLRFTSAVPSAGTVTGSVLWNAGSSQSRAATLTGVAAGSTTITVSAPGFAPATSAAIQVTAP